MCNLYNIIANLLNKIDNTIETKYRTQKNQESCQVMRYNLCNLSLIITNTREMVESMVKPFV